MRFSSCMSSKMLQIAARSNSTQKMPFKRRGQVTSWKEKMVRSHYNSAWVATFCFRNINIFQCNVVVAIGQNKKMFVIIWPMKIKKCCDIVVNIFFFKNIKIQVAMRLTCMIIPRLKVHQASGALLGVCLQEKERMTTRRGYDAYTFTSQIRNPKFQLRY